MEPDRGGRPRRGGDRPNRRRPSGREKQAESSGQRGEEGRNRGGGSRRGRGGGRGRRGGGGRGTAASPSAPLSHEAATTELELPAMEKEEQGSFSRRKVVSNWHRYEDSEKETQNDSGESQRGTDFSILLSSAGDSFTQFRFAEEKEWIAENLCPKQLSGLYVDCQSLVQALEELPLNLKLNVSAELLQDATPVTLPQVKLQSHDLSKMSGGSLQHHVTQKRDASHCYPVADSATHLTLPNNSGTGVLSDTLQISPSHQSADHLDEDLDLLLKLDAPINPESNLSLETVIDGVAIVEDLKMTVDKTELDRTEKVCSPLQEKEVTSKNITEEELEDWLDSMIS